MLRLVAGPVVERIDADALRKRVGGEGGAAGIAAREQDGVGIRRYLERFPLVFWSGLENDVRPTGANVASDGRTFAGDLLDVARQERGRLLHAGGFGGLDDDVADGVAGDEGDG